MYDHRTDTLDADDLGLSEEFLADECMARQEDEYDYHFGEPKCGGRRGSEYGGPPACDGCRHCYPPDFEAKPYGYGIDRFEDPALLYANEWVHMPHNRAILNSNCNNTGFRRSERDRVWAMNSTQSKLRAKASDVVWGRLCDECETHPEAVAAYAAWAKRALAIRFKDEPK